MLTLKFINFPFNFGLQSFNKKNHRVTLPLSHPLTQDRALYTTLGEAVRNGFTGGTITLEALIWAKTIKLVISAVFLVAVKRSLQGLI